MANPLIEQIPGTTSTGRKLRRVSTYGAGSLSGFDMRNTSIYPASIVPATAIPSGTFLENLMRTPGSTSDRATVNAATVQSATGGIVVDNTKNISLPNDFKLPALNGAAGRYLILLGLKVASAATPGAAQYVAGWATNSSSAANWLIYQNSGNANYNLAVGNAFANFTLPDTLQHRVAIEIIKLAATVQLNVYKDGVLVTTGSATAVAAIPQPASGGPNVGAGLVGNGWPAGGELNSIEIRNLDLDTDSVASIVAADFAAWGARFA